MAYLYRKKRPPFWHVVYFDASQKEVHRSTGLCADDPNDTSRAKAWRAELEAMEHHREADRRVQHQRPLGSRKTVGIFDTARTLAEFNRDIAETEERIAQYILQQKAAN